MYVVWHLLCAERSAFCCKNDHFFTSPGELIFIIRAFWFYSQTQVFETQGKFEISEMAPNTFLTRVLSCKLCFLFISKLEKNLKEKCFFASFDEIQFHSYSGQMVPPDLFSIWSLWLWRQVKDVHGREYTFITGWWHWALANEKNLFLIVLPCHKNKSRKAKTKNIWINDNNFAPTPSHNQIFTLPCYQVIIISSEQG